MTKSEICRKVTDLGKLGQRTLVYSVTCDINQSERDYGVSISIAENGEEMAIRCITTRVEQALGLVDLLASNFVTPVCLEDVVLDWIADN